MTAQINVKMEAELKKNAQKVAKALGFSLSDLTRAFYSHLVRTKRVDFALEDDWGDTPDDLTGEKLEKELIEHGYSKEYAKADREAYEDMLKAKKEGKLIEWSRF